VNQDVQPEKIFAMNFPRLNDPAFVPVAPRLSFRFLSSPKAFIADSEGRVKQMIVTENDLALRGDGTTAARATDQSSILDVDTVLFAIGDTHDPQIGLPMGPEGYATRPAGPSDAASFEVWDPAGGALRPGLFVVGWARKASTGLAGLARHDGEDGARRALAYLKDLPDSGTLGSDEILSRLKSKGIRIIDQSDLALLALAEQRKGPLLSPNSFHYNEADAIFHVIDEERRRASLDASAETMTAD
jgi:ferredoxin/flavodoxin---NADP+ reductase